jgi:deoxyribonuclease V
MDGIPHSWNLSPTEAIALQKRLAPLVDRESPLDLLNLNWVAGIDVSVKNEISRASVVMLSFPDLTIAETVTAQMPTPFPYIPGLLSFREGQVILAAYEKLKQAPDAIIIDGMGIMHPRRLGIASHIGLWLDVPTVGCGKTYFLGTYADPAPEKGAWQPLFHEGEILGAVLRTRDNVKPVYISVGHRATLETACELVMRCVTRYRLPEPIRAAHNAAGDF